MQLAAARRRPIPRPVAGGPRPVAGGPRPVAGGARPAAGGALLALVLACAGCKVDASFDAGVHRRTDMRLGGCYHCASECCDGVCLDTMGGDVKNCGGCGKECGPDEQCVSGVCECPGASGPCSASQTCCPGTTTGCVDLTSDLNNCGACGKPCDSSAADSCVGGQCQCGSGAECAGLACCGGACVDPNSDPNNCGGCGVSCMGGTCQGATCQGGGPPGSCTNDVQCGAGFQCINGMCTNNTGACTTNADCGGGTCILGQCLGGCTPPCAPGQQCILGVLC